MNVKFIKLAKLSLILIYLVIIAGAVVRMTGSGMGCPDWPKCFGYYIPPTDAKTLQWQPNRVFIKGQVIIYEESLQVAKNNFTTTGSFELNNWKPYLKHDYAKFNVWHTWIEYINRLLGALAGLATLALALFSIRFWKERKYISIVSLLVVFGMGFQAWLGATVVYSVLEPVKITTHMIMALVIVALLLLIIHKASQKNTQVLIAKSTQALVLSTLILTLIQIVLGTQVRQFVDDQLTLVGENAKNLWLENPSIQFYIHRSMSILVFLLNGYLFFDIRKKQLPFDKIKWIAFIIMLEIISGIAMYYFDFPFASQPLHLVLASVLFGIQFYLFLEATNKSKSHKSL
ncbi:COX15/CtaA family protein [Croceitalea rosinachiae]|uniref:COX15/CtaA family protein n=1 Tax=Croceitalea rosinachiae TaxID=3075596 RepID=A0ABU3AE43_9FLAO|nr:COX15/CtaA family protein [Croceitalea sp. F388]MDT0608264.1 COX15/CtaA family protein [Croceitalea sp. F388]